MIAAYDATRFSDTWARNHARSSFRLLSASFQVPLVRMGNAYRYAPWQFAGGRDGVLLFGISHRAYGMADAKAFVQDLSSLRTARIRTLSEAPLPKPEP